MHLQPSAKSLGSAPYLPVPHRNLPAVRPCLVPQWMRDSCADSGNYVEGPCHHRQSDGLGLLAAKVNDGASETKVPRFAPDDRPAFVI